jgi:hypothetical protein
MIDMEISNLNSIIINIVNNMVKIFQQKIYLICFSEEIILLRDNQEFSIQALDLLGEEKEIYKMEIIHFCNFSNILISAEINNNNNNSNNNNKIEIKRETDSLAFCRCFLFFLYFLEDFFLIC